MADNSTLVSEAGRSLLADSSVLESKITETSKENVFPGSVPHIEGNERSSLQDYCIFMMTDDFVGVWWFGTKSAVLNYRNVCRVTKRVLV